MRDGAGWRRTSFSPLDFILELHMLHICVTENKSDISFLVSLKNEHIWQSPAQSLKINQF